MTETCSRLTTAIDAPRGDLLANTSRQIAVNLRANGMWIGLSEDVLSRISVPGATTLPNLLAWLPTSAQDAIKAAGGGRFVGLGFSAPAAQIGEMVISDQQSGPFWVAIPLTLQGHSSGLLLLARDTPFQSNEFDERFEIALQILITTIEHTLFQQTISQYHCSMETLHTITLRLGSTLDLQEVLVLLTRSVLEITPADAAFIYTRSTEAGAPEQFTLGADSWLDPNRRPTGAHPLPEAIVDAIAVRNWPLIIEKISEHPLRTSLATTGWGNGSLAGYPLLRGGRLMGIFIISFFQPHSLNAEERYLISLLTDQALVAIDNARVAQNMSYQLAELSALQHLAQKITITLDPEQTLKIIVQTLHEMFDAAAADIMLLEDDDRLHRVILAGEAHFLIDPPELAMGEGISGRAMLNRQPIYHADLATTELKFKIPPRLRSLIAIPLMARSHAIGVMSISSFTPNTFGAPTERMLSIAAAQAAIAIENAHLYQSEHHRAEELNILIELSHLITQHMEMDRIFDAAYQAVLRLMKAEAFVISLRDRQTQEVIRLFIVDKGVRYPASNQPSRGLSEYVIETGQPLLITDLTQEKLPFQQIHFGDKEAVHSLIAVPLLFGEQANGMVAAESYQAGAYNAHHLQLLQSIANDIAIAVENSYLYANLTQRYKESQNLEQQRLEFIQNVLHDVRNPLTFLRAYIDLLLAGDLGEMNARQTESLKVVSEKTAALIRLVENFATLETSSRSRMQFQETDLVRLVRNSILLAQEIASQSGIRIILEAENNLPNVQVDTDRIAQVVDNLLGNAIKFGYTDSKVTIRIQACDEHIQVSVSNEGDPISKQDQERLFTRFFQAEATRSERRKKGSGLGLAIVKHLVEAHQGKVWVESEAGKGTTFYFTLPYHQGNAS